MTQPRATIVGALIIAAAILGGALIYSKHSGGPTSPRLSLPTCHSPLAPGEKPGVTCA